MSSNERADDRAGERVLTLRCAYCREPFTPVRRHQRYDRPACRVAAFKAGGLRRRPVSSPDEDGDRLAGMFE